MSDDARSSRPSSSLSWRDGVAEWRDRLVGSPRFQRWAASFPLTRPIAKRQARTLFDLCAGFVYSQVLYACVRLTLFDLLADAPQSATALAARCGLSLDAMERLLGAAVALRLVERRKGNRFGLGMQGAALRANPSVVAMIEHHALLYADLADPVALLRGEAPPTRLAGYWPYKASDAAALGTADVAGYTALMGASQAFIAADVLDAYDVSRHRRLLDVGGGNGSFLAAAATRAPALRLVLFDLPAVAALADKTFADVGCADRADIVGGDFLADELPTGADLVSLVRVVHDQDDSRALALLRAARRAIADDGTLILAEPLAGTAGAEPIGEAYFGFYLLAMGRGRARTERELHALLIEAGFDRIARRNTRLPLLTSLIVARPSLRKDRSRPVNFN